MNFGVESQNLNFFKRVGSSRLTNGAQELQVEEPLFVAKSALFEFEVSEVAEPKALKSEDLATLIKKYGSIAKASKTIGVSEAFVRQNIKIKQPSGK